MLSVAEAQELVLSNARPLPAVTAELSPALLGRRLAEAVVSDVDSPPHDKSAMDGYAICRADLRKGQILSIIEEIAAGQVPTRTIRPGLCSRIMTGAPIPAGTDAVVPLEQTRLTGDRVELMDGSTNENIVRRGREMRQGDTILNLGQVLGPVEVGVLATVGHTRVSVTPAPTLAVVSTGDEVVEPSETPGPGQLRNSNGSMLLALAAGAGAVPRYLGIARDDVESLRKRIREGLSSDVLVLSGGVSMGARDLVPAVLATENVRPIFHKVLMKPGKPILFGVCDTNDRRCLVFGLPGNPVSSLVCFALFVRPALWRSAGHSVPLDFTVSARLTEEFAYRTDRPTYHPAELAVGPTGWEVRALPGGGSSDLLSLTRANALVVLPDGDHVHRTGQLLPVVRLDPVPWREGWPARLCK
jgi:molybdopterin molybdotransferase